jgi:hypothetical protein
LRRIEASGSASNRRADVARSGDEIRRARGRAGYLDPRRLRCSLGIFGSVGVTGMDFGGVFAGRAAACFASASRTISLVTIGG